MMSTQVMAQSKVLHMRGLPPGATSDELVSYMANFGPVGYVMMLPNRGQALIEFDALEAAAAVMNYAQSSPIIVAGKQCYVNYSKSAQINRGAATRVGVGGPAPGMGGGAGGGGGYAASGAVEHHGERVILMTVNNAIYPITVDVLSTILQPYGSIVRMVIFTKKGVQALVEFEEPTSAAKAQVALDGKEIYDGCCQLRIVFSRNDRLNVHTNNERTRDFTNPHLPSTPHPEGPAIGYAAGGSGGAAAGGWGGYGGGQQAAYGAAAYGGYGQAPAYGGGQYGGYPPQQAAYGGYPAGAGGYGGGVGGGAASGPPGRGGYGGPAMAGGAGGGAGAPGGPQSGPAVDTPVVIVFNIPSSCGVQQLFNLFSLYGNIVRIKTLPKTDAALIQMQDHVQAEGAMRHLNSMALFDKTLQVTFSKHAHIADGRPKDGESDADAGECQDFGNSMLNRFKKPEHFKHIYTATQLVHFGNCPGDTTEESLTKLFVDAGASAPSRIKFFEPRDGGAGSDRKVGLAEFASAKAAVEAVALANNVEVSGHTVRLSFTNNTL